MFVTNDRVQILGTQFDSLNGQNGSVIRAASRAGWHRVKLDFSNRKFFFREQHLFFIPLALVETKGQSHESAVAFVQALEAPDHVAISKETEAFAESLGIDFRSVCV